MINEMGIYPFKKMLLLSFFLEHGKLSIENLALRSSHNNVTYKMKIPSAFARGLV